MKRCQIGRDIMVTELFTLPPETHVFDGIAFLLRHNISGAPVVDQDRNYLGVFSEKCCMSVLTLSAQLAREAEKPGPTIRAKDFMVKRLVMIPPGTDVFEAVSLILKHRISGIPVVDDQRRFLGVISERYVMQVVIDAAYNQLPTCEVSAFMNTDKGRVIDENEDLLDIARIFLETHFRRLAVVKEERLVGQISRRDVLRAEYHLSSALRDRESLIMDRSDQILLSDIAEKPGHEPLSSPQVSEFMDREAQTIHEEIDILSIAQVFRQTNYRRLPVLRDGKIIGQISRRDLLRAIHEIVNVTSQRESGLLYLSALVDGNESPVL